MKATAILATGIYALLVFNTVTGLLRKCLMETLISIASCYSVKIIIKIGKMTSTP